LKPNAIENQLDKSQIFKIVSPRLIEHHFLILKLLSGLCRKYFASPCICFKITHSFLVRYHLLHLGEHVWFRVHFFQSFVFFEFLDFDSICTIDEFLQRGQVLRSQLLWLQKSSLQNFLNSFLFRWIWLFHQLLHFSWQSFSQIRFRLF